MALRLEDLAKTIDHTLAGAGAGPDDVDRLCEAGQEHHLASVCVLPEHVSRAAERLRGCDVKVCAVVGFPLGEAEGRLKVASAQRCVAEGADELEFVVNVPALAGGDARLVRDELVLLNRVVRMQSVNVGRDVVLKVVVEAARLDDKLKRLACRIVEHAGADFAQTATGLTPDGASVLDVELLRDCLSEHVGVKASGGIETVEDALAMVNAGAGRVGIPAGAAAMRSFAVREPV